MDAQKFFDKVDEYEKMFKDVPYFMTGVSTDLSEENYRMMEEAIKTRKAVKIPEDFYDDGKIY
jgi:non-homologous end joining protein Ku